MLGDRHGLKLRVAEAEQQLRVIMLRPLDQNFCPPVQHDPSESGPILVVVIDDHRNRRVLLGFGASLLNAPIIE